MDHYSILDQSLPPATAAVPHSTPKPGMPLTAAARTGVRFPVEDGGSFADMAQRDLDAALQLLADRAQYITDASGAAIALRRKDLNDLLCRATAGTNAPELGALLSAESGLSGESMRTRRALRCADAERDPRVNRVGCRELGIVSVVVMPIVRDDDALGVFEIFSGKAAAFGERDLSALHRLSEMVETAVTLAESAPSSHGEIVAEVTLIEEHSESAAGFDAEVADVSGETAVTVSGNDAPRVSTIAPVQEPLSPAIPMPSSISPPKKSLLWSAALPVSDETQKSIPADQSHVPLVMRSLHKCRACGFPVSEGRKLCVECEEKRWRGQLPASAAMAAGTNQATALAQVDKLPSRLVESPPKSWLASNKYIMGALLVVVIVIVAAIVFLR